MIKLQNFNDGEVWKCNCGVSGAPVYKYKVNGVVLGEYHSMQELYDNHAYKKPLKKKK